MKQVQLIVKKNNEVKQTNIPVSTRKEALSTVVKLVDSAAFMCFNPDNGDVLSEFRTADSKTVEIINKINQTIQVIHACVS